MSGKYTLHIHIRNLTDYMNYLKFIWTHSFSGTISISGRCIDAHNAVYLLLQVPFDDGELRFSWMPDETMEEYLRFFREHYLLAGRDSRSLYRGNRPAFQN